MHAFKLVPLFLAALVAAQASEDSKVFLQPGLRGKSENVPDNGNCHELSKPFHSKVRSIEIPEDYKCEFYGSLGLRDLHCQDYITEYWETEFDIRPGGQSVRCDKRPRGDDSN
ncbi:unnamed protein product [Clonostachys chloroleuca]|uniref:Uncharacterized protein n=1 Tax=Clonostachys chloroleuca TaxID=1926264 RepID=A0AA35Q082_9HYPO|nr:unnamed protein product [Clonostachys chloroleuca]